MHEEAALHAAPLRELGAGNLRKYAGDALLVWGDVALFKHFLPRIFELYFTVNSPWVEVDDPESLFSKFRRASWKTWPPTERSAVDTLLHAAWQAVLQDPPDSDEYINVETWLCALAQAEDDLGPYLHHWQHDDSLAACHALSALLISGLLDLAERNPWWEGREEQLQHVQSWLHSQRVRTKLAACVARWPELEEFSAALSIVEDVAE